MTKKIIKTVVKIAVGLLVAFITKWTWNFTMPYLLSVPVITWGQAWCLQVLSDCLFNRHKV